MYIMILLTFISMSISDISASEITKYCKTKISNGNEFFTMRQDGTSIPGYIKNFDEQELVVFYSLEGRKTWTLSNENVLLRNNSKTFPDNYFHDAYSQGSPKGQLIGANFSGFFVFSNNKMSFDKIRALKVGERRPATILYANSLKGHIYYSDGKLILIKQDDNKVFREYIFSYFRESIVGISKINEEFDAVMSSNGSVFLLRSGEITEIYNGQKGDKIISSYSDGEFFYLELRSRKIKFEISSRKITFIPEVDISRFKDKIYPNNSEFDNITIIDDDNILIWNRKIVWIINKGIRRVLFSNENVEIYNVTYTGNDKGVLIINNTGVSVVNYNGLFYNIDINDIVITSRILSIIKNGEKFIINGKNNIYTIQNCSHMSQAE